MSRNQYALFVGVLLVWLAWDAGWVVLAAVAAGLIGLGVVRVLDGGLDLGELSEQIRSSAKLSKNIWPTLGAPGYAQLGTRLALLALT